VLLGLLALSRPEGVLAGGLICAWVLLSRPGRAVAVRIVAPFVVMVAALESFRLAYYGALVPNTFHAKEALLSEGWATLRDFVLFGLGFAGPLAMVPALRASRPARRLAWIALVLSAGFREAGTAGCQPKAEDDERYGDRLARELVREDQRVR